MAVRAIRGATCLEADDFAEMSGAVSELLGEMQQRNGLSAGDFISVLFTCTPDLRCGFPAGVAREIGFTDVPLMCAQELDVPGSLPRVVRIMAHVESSKSRSEIVHVFLRGAQVLRQDLSDG